MSYPACIACTFFWFVPIVYFTVLIIKPELINAKIEGEEVLGTMGIWYARGGLIVVNIVIDLGMPFGEFA